MTSTYDLACAVFSTTNSFKVISRHTHFLIPITGITLGLYSVDPMNTTIVSNSQLINNYLEVTNIEGRKDRKLGDISFLWKVSTENDSLIRVHAGSHSNLIADNVLRNTLSSCIRVGNTLQPYPACKRKRREGDERRGGKEGGKGRIEAEVQAQENDIRRREREGIRAEARRETEGGRREKKKKKREGKKTTKKRKRLSSHFQIFWSDRNQILRNVLIQDVNVNTDTGDGIQVGSGMKEITKN